MFGKRVSLLRSVITCRLKTYYMTTVITLYWKAYNGCLSDISALTVEVACPQCENFVKVQLVFPRSLQ